MEESGCAWHLDGTLETVLESGDGRLGHLDLLPRLQGSHLGVSQPLVFLTSLSLFSRDDTFYYDGFLQKPGI